MGTDTEQIKKRAPTLYAIIAIKLLKGALFATLAIVAYTLSDNNLPVEYQNLLHHLRVNRNGNSGPTWRFVLGILPSQRW
jgi:hypothetical protein